MVFARKIISSCLFFFFLIINSYFLISAAITYIFIAFAELPIPTRIATKKAKSEIETHLVTVDAKISIVFSIV